MRVAIGMMMMFLGMGTADSESLVPTMVMLAVGALILLPEIKEE